jgi:chemotaxis protein methyltransferase CheR
LQRLAPHGLLFIGISESIGGLELPVTARGPSIYASQPKQSPPPLVPVHAAPAPAPAATRAPVPSSPASRTAPAAVQPGARPKPLRILCVDDSASIIALLRKILANEHGFEIVGTAANGLEAARQLQTLAVDLVTLDIHMPEQSGLEYLQQHWRPGHPPVVMVSSVAREDAQLALRCLEAGATDYVEKPALATFAERGEEIRTKLKAAHRAAAFAAGAASRPTAVSGVDRAFARAPVIAAPDRTLRLVVAGPGDRDKLRRLVAEVGGPAQAPTLILMEGALNALDALAPALGATLASPALGPLQAGRAQLGDFAALIDAARAAAAGRRVAVLVYGDITAAARERLRQWSGAHILIEDLGQGWSGSLLAKAPGDVMPATSFAYMSTIFLAGAP